ncbi:hypothetical protein [Brevundimonas bullata]
MGSNPTASAIRRCDLWDQTKEAQDNVHHREQQAKASDHSKDQRDLEMPMQKIENFTRHLRLSSDCGPYWHNTGQTLQQPCVKTF